MKSFFTTVVALAALSLLCGQAQVRIRSNYRLNSITHISTDYVLLKQGDSDPHPFWVRLELVGFSDGSSAYQLYMNFEEKTAVNIPKGVKMAVTLSDGKLIRSDQLYERRGTNRSFTSGKNRVYWNRTRYMFEPSDISKMAKGVKSIDVITGYDPDDYFQVKFNGNALGSFISSAVAAINAVKKNTVDIDGKVIDRYSDNNNSLTVFAKPVVVKGTRYKYNTGLTLLYYKNTNKEDFDIRMQIGTDRELRLAYGKPVVLTLGDGTSVNLVQERDETNFICCYPSLEQVRSMLEKGVKSISYETSEGKVEDSFPEGAFKTALNKGYQALMSVSPY